MNDDLNILVTYILKDYTVHKVALSVKHGLNTFCDWQYFREPEVKEQYLNLLDNGEMAFKIEEILEVIEINDIKITKIELPV